MSSLVDTLVERGHDVVFQLQKDIDIIFMMDPRYEEGGSSAQEIYSYKLANPSTKIIHRINECDARKNTNDIDRLLLSANSIADKTVFISEWLQSYFHSKGFNRQSVVIYNGCNSSHFYPRQNLDASFPVKIVTHHWSDNWMKGFDAYKRIDELCKSNPNKYQFTYIGRYCKEYVPIATKIVQPLYGKELGEELRQHDVYITASRWEPCGMHHIEGAASGLPVLYHKDGGGIVEGCRKHGMEFDNDNLIEKLDLVVKDRKRLIKLIDHEWLSMQRCMSSYLQLIEEVGNV